MAVEPLTGKDFRVFDIPGFAERMAAIRSQIRPKLEGLGSALAPSLTRTVRIEVFPHVAKHARRTVNAPDDTWVAFGPDRRGYKKAQHFKIAVSRHAVRLLFEIGPEYAAKPAWAKAWRREAPRLAASLGKGGGLGWFKNEHDEKPGAALGDLDRAGWISLGEALLRTRDGQLVLGRRVDAAVAARWTAADCLKAAGETFAALGECFRLA